MQDDVKKIIAGSMSAICRSTKLMAMVGAAPAVLPLATEAANRVFNPAPEETNSKMDMVISELSILKQTNPEAFEKIIASLKTFRL